MHTVATPLLATTRLVREKSASPGRGRFNQGGNRRPPPPGFVSKTGNATTATIVRNGLEMGTKRIRARNPDPSESTVLVKTTPENSSHQPLTTTLTDDILERKSRPV